jgi:hypothetical protein
MKLSQKEALASQELMEVAFRDAMEAGSKVGSVEGAMEVDIVNFGGDEKRKGGKRRRRNGVDGWILE